MLKNLKQNTFLALSMGIVYLWFGTLKFFPSLSPAETLAIDTIEKLTLGYIPTNVSIILLALLEVVIGASLLLNVYRRTTAFIALGHLACTFIPFFFFANLTFNDNPFTLTLVGQYIIKNIVLIAALLSILKMDKKMLQRVNV